MPPKKNKLPDGWFNCPKYGVLIQNKFMPLKTPLSKNFDTKLPPENRFYPQDIFNVAKSKGIRFGLWIDLTNTDRYYSSHEIFDLDCSYKKLACRGAGELPSRPYVNTFINLIDSYIKENPNDCIAIHCTHGFNRTGFLLVSFFVERLKIPVRDAIELFASCRPPGIYRHEYIMELCKRYGSLADVPERPSTPPWKI
ncbi:mRNA-capping enzyme [Aethina tumida]|uniref:mRNA-capping enzyme n=1 Tax=Aethina tumida TaxID=116153 RepID=UPI00096ADC5A|nr:mRNA-capping enzyme [Aethina tumida]